MRSIGGALDLERLLINNGIQTSYCKLQVSSGLHFPSPSPPLKSLSIIDLDPCTSVANSTKLMRITCYNRKQAKIYAMRRRRASIESETYVLMEPGRNEEEFVTEEELTVRLKWWLENWPGKALPPDLAKFETVDDAVLYLVRSVCELEIDGDVGSVQWYEVRLE
ncbi:hypothetical protein Ancab_018342 [Ancistrocladus abbreviatus]